ncbi:MAG: tetratricopeptide repeat protein [Pseudomonadota bacterium]
MKNTHFPKSPIFTELEREALIASEVEPEEKVDHYVKKLDQLNERLCRGCPSSEDPEEKAKIVFHRLWEKKPFRYKIRGPFRLNEVIDAQLDSPSQVVGNCLGLTLLFNCLLRRLGIMAGALYIDNAFDIGPHVLTSLAIENVHIDIENIFVQGFDYKGHLHHPSRTRWGDRELIADVYLSLGNECYDKGKFTEALSHYEKAVELNPKYENAHLNRAMLIEKEGSR